jgi:putative SOS response-associated peptidase YedK
MCGRFTLKTPAHVLREMFGVTELPGFTPRYNIAPTQPAATVRLAEEERAWVPMRWGLIPFWARDAAIGNRMINARAETVANKPAFREPFERRRCLVPSDGFYEWQRVSARHKQPWFLHLADERPFAFAGLWDRWRPNPAEERTLSFTIVTTAPNATVAPIHDRMPVILEEPDFDAWLSPETDPRELERLMAPIDASRIVTRPVSTLVNRPANDDPRCVEAATAIRPGTLFD